MVKIDALRRVLLPCLTPPNTTTTTHKATSAIAATPAKKRLSTSLRDDIPDDKIQSDQQQSEQADYNDDDETEHVASSRPSKTMVIGTIFGRRRGHVWFCVQHDRHSTKPSVLLELSIPITQLVKEMQCGLVRVAMECSRTEPELNSCHLHYVPEWVLFLNGKKVGFAVRRKASGEIREMLRKMENTTIGAGVIPGASDGIMYMRANYECVVGSADSESFHLINPDGYPNQELSVFLLRSR